eukprot:RCo043868
MGEGYSSTIPLTVASEEFFKVSSGCPFPFSCHHFLLPVVLLFLSLKVIASKRKGGVSWAILETGRGWDAEGDLSFCLCSVCCSPPVDGGLLSSNVWMNTRDEFREYSKSHWCTGDAMMASPVAILCPCSSFVLGEMIPPSLQPSVEAALRAQRARVAERAFFIFFRVFSLLSASPPVGSNRRWDCFSY